MLGFWPLGRVWEVAGGAQRTWVMLGFGYLTNRIQKSPAKQCRWETQTEHHDEQSLSKSRFLHVCLIHCATSSFLYLDNFKRVQDVNYRMVTGKCGGYFQFS